MINSKVNAIRVVQPFSNTKRCDIDLSQPTSAEVYHLFTMYSSRSTDLSPNKRIESIGSWRNTEPEEFGAQMTVGIIRSDLESSNQFETPQDTRSAEQTRADIESLPFYCSIQDFSSAISFEELQHASFTRAAVPLILSLRPIKRQEAIESLLGSSHGDERENLEHALRIISSSTVLYVSGEGGCGKSCVELGLR